MLVLKDINFSYCEPCQFNPGEPAYECRMWFGSYHYEGYELNCGFRYTLSVDKFNGVPYHDREPSWFQCETNHRFHMHDTMVIYLKQEEIAVIYEKPIQFFEDYLKSTDAIKHPYVQTVVCGAVGENL